MHPMAFKPPWMRNWGGTSRIVLLVFQTYQGKNSQSLTFNSSHTGYFWEHSGYQIVQGIVEYQPC